MNLAILKTHFKAFENHIKTLRVKLNSAIIRDKYAVCITLSVLSTLLSVANPLLSALIVNNLINNLNISGIIASIVALIAVKGTRMLLKGRVNKLLRDDDIKAPLEWVQKKISKYLWWLEPTIKKWGFLGKYLSKIKGGLNPRISSAAASFITEIINLFLSGLVFFFTKSYVLSVLVSFVIPTLAVIPWFNKQSIKFQK